MVEVQSSNIKAIGYNEDDKTIRIEFLSGTKGDYYPCSKIEYEAFMLSESKGKHFNLRIKAAKLHLPVDETTGEGAAVVTVKNPTEKSLSFDESKGRLEQTTGRIQDHFFEVRNAFRERQN